MARRSFPPGAPVSLARRRAWACAGHRVPSGQREQARRAADVATAHARSGSHL